MSLILLIDDNLDLLDVLTMSLENKGHRVLVADDGLAGLEMFQQHDPDLVVLDIMMPIMNGWEVCHRLREISNVPIIILTVLGQETNIVRGLQEGADDYMTKPFSARELLGRVEALLRREQMSKKSAWEQNITAGDWVLIQEAHQVIVNGRRIKLTSIEFRLLSTLIEYAGRVVPHHVLFSEVWGQEYEADVQHLKVYI